jgi:hypothetical protein
MTVDHDPSADDPRSAGTRPDSPVRTLASLVAGLMAGVCLTFAAGCWILLAAWRVSPRTPATVSPVVSARTATAVATPVEGIPTILLKAETLRHEGDPQAVVALLSASLDSLTPHYRARAYELLGQSELELGHSSLAGASFERAYELEPTVERLYGAALGYDLGGDEDRALGAYMEIAAWEGEQADPYRDLALARIDQLHLLLGTPYPQ